MPSCNVYSCRNHSKSTNKDGKISFFNIPDDADIAKKWIEFCGRDVSKLKEIRVCSAHFDPELVIRPPAQYYDKPPRASLVKGAIPTIKLNNDEPKTKRRRKRRALSDVSPNVCIVPQSKKVRSEDISNGEAKTSSSCADENVTFLPEQHMGVEISSNTDEIHITEMPKTDFSKRQGYSVDERHCSLSDMGLGNNKVKDQRVPDLLRSLETDCGVTLLSQDCSIPIEASYVGATLSTNKSIDQMVEVEKKRRSVIQSVPSNNLNTARSEIIDTIDIAPRVPTTLLTTGLADEINSRRDNEISIITSGVARSDVAVESGVNKVCAPAMDHDYCRPSRLSTQGDDRSICDKSRISTVHTDTLNNSTSPGSKGGAASSEPSPIWEMEDEQR
ncbi:hypothetical protein QAD02_021014 [Eretmocerus hayati]|uniref:Uncharacterized protein n=1 Tax=Eretmocerus hayati TaxID=131215 RepID=A0ACC2PNY9_9HYME|nr:hypothetical protein QAD02_021014 [Eretmocerus hayati]